nr:reverse transcriptase domain-containing protein [Tanacetum cinerariifolium]
NETFPLETLSMVTFRGDSSAPWKPLIFSRLATMDPSGDIMARTTPSKREKSRKVMKCLKIPSKFARFLTYEASISWGCSRLHEETTFQSLKKKLTEALILVAPDWDLPFELMCDASDFAIGAVLGQRKTKHIQHIHYARKTMTDALAHYTTTEKELLAVVYAFEKFQPYLVLSKSIVYMDHSALKYLFNKQDDKPRLLWDVIPTKEQILQRRETLLLGRINETFPLETLNMVSFHGDSSTPWNIFLGKLKTRWTGPFTITQVFPYGTIELSQTDGPNFKVNGHRLKHYFEEDIPPMVVLDFQTFPKDQ